MGTVASSEGPTALTGPIRVLFLGDDGTTSSCAYEYTKYNLTKYPDIHVVQSTPATLTTEINRADIIVPLSTSITKGVIARAANLKLICQFGHDVSNIDLDAAKAAAIPVTRIPSRDAGIAESSVEYALCLAISVLRKMFTLPAVTAPVGSPLGKNLCGMNALVFGDGSIGDQLTMCLQAMGTNATCVSPADPAYLAALPTADILFFCCRPTEQTKRMIDINFLSKTKDGVYIINVSQSQLVNFDDLHDALKTDKIGGVALEANHKETVHPIMSDSRVFLCPQSADATEISYKCMAGLVSANILRAVRGESLVDAVLWPEMAENESIAASTVAPTSPV